MTEEEKKAYIKREARRLYGNFPEMPEGMIDVIIEWNLANENNQERQITDSLIDWVREAAHKKNHVNYLDLLSEDSEVAYGTLISIIEREPAVKVCRSKELERMFERFVFNFQNFIFGDGKNADEVKPLK